MYNFQYFKLAIGLTLFLFDFTGIPWPNRIDHDRVSLQVIVLSFVLTLTVYSWKLSNSLIQCNPAHNVQSIHLANYTLTVIASPE